jgi:asparagine synthetase B (glutamine-hydrolysing)
VQYFRQLYFSERDQRLARATKPTIRTTRQAMTALDNRFTQDIRHSLEAENNNDTLGVMLSGGVDSSLLVAMLSILTDKKIVCFTVMTDNDDPDVLPSKQIAKQFDVKWVKCVIRKRDLPEQLPDVLKLSKAGLYGTAASLALDTCLRYCSELGVKSLWLGNGLDMLFGGGVDPDDIKGSDSKKFHAAFWRKAFDLLVNRFYEQSGDDIATLAAKYRVKIVMPFESIESIMLARSIPATLLFKYDEDKYPVRLLAHKYGVPLSLARREKLPLQDSSGTFDLLREYMYESLPSLVTDGVNFRLTKQYFESNPNTDLQLFLALVAKQEGVVG